MIGSSSAGEWLGVCVGGCEAELAWLRCGEQLPVEEVEVEVKVTVLVSRWCVCRRLGWLG